MMSFDATASELVDEYKGSGTRLEVPLSWVSSAKDALSVWAHDARERSSWVFPSAIVGSVPSVIDPLSLVKVRSPVEAFVVSHQPRTQLRVDSAISVQAWEGEVLEVTERSITVKLIDKTDRTAQDAFTELDLSEVDEDDLDLVRPGAIFYWYVSYEQRASGKKRSGMIRFRRVPAWTADDLKRIEAYADDLFNSLSFEQFPGTESSAS